MDLRGHSWFETRRGTLTAVADVAQLVERNLAKVEVAGSIPVVRSRGRSLVTALRFGDVAEWLGKGLQNPLPGFDSRRRLYSTGSGAGVARDASCMGSLLSDGRRRDASGE